MPEEETLDLCTDALLETLESLQADSGSLEECPLGRGGEEWEQPVFI